MIKNYLFVALRSLRKNPVYSAINIGGLSLGLAACWLITLYVSHELRYDSFNKKAARIYRVVQHGRWTGGQYDLAVTPAPLARAMASEFPGVESTVRLDAEGGGTATYHNRQYTVNDMLFADSSVFGVFTFHFLYGDARSALTAPNSIVLTKSLARKIFGAESNAPGKIISFGNDKATRVTGVIDDVPENAHFTFSALRSMPPTGGDWKNAYLYTYLLLRENAAVAALEKDLPAFYRKYGLGETGEETYNVELQPLTDIHLHSHLAYEMSDNGNITYIRIFSLVALLILLIASINYMNLSTARSSLRIKEVAVRKVNGSGRVQLVLLFLTESVVVTLMAAGLAMVMVQLGMEWFRHFTGKPISLWQLGTRRTLGGLIIFSLLAGCLSGIYPALFLSGFKLIPSLKGARPQHGGHLAFRRSLVVFQFIVTTALMAGSFVIRRQLEYVNHTDLGFNRQQVLSFHLPQALRNRIPQMEQQLLLHSSIESVATASNPIGNNNIGGRDFSTIAEGKTTAIKDKANLLQVDEDFIPTLQIQVKWGRNFSPGMKTDKTQQVLVNATLAAKAGWKDAVGHRLQLGTDEQNRPVMYQVAGVVKDFNIYSLQHRIEPFILQLPPQENDRDNMYVRVRAGMLAEGVTTLGTVFKNMAPNQAFDYSFVDQNFARQYASEAL